jgi:Domain of unknown function (DU1801)
MAELKTQRTHASVAEFLDRVDNAVRREDAQAVLALMTEVTGERPAMWGSSIVGFGSYEYHYGSGRRGVWATVGFSPRKQSLVIYIAEGLGAHADLLGRLGRHSTGKGCLYLPRLSDVDLEVLRELVRHGFDQINGKVITPGAD